MAGTARAAEGSHCPGRCWPSGTFCGCPGTAGPRPNQTVGPGGPGGPSSTSPRRDGSSPHQATTSTSAVRGVCSAPEVSERSGMVVSLLTGARGSFSIDQVAQPAQGPALVGGEQPVPGGLAIVAQGGLADDEVVHGERVDLGAGAGLEGVAKGSGHAVGEGRRDPGARHGLVLHA